MSGQRRIADDGADQHYPSGTRVTVEIETPFMSFIKRRSDGSIDFISPLPCIFDYGFIPGTMGGDGDPQDAIFLDGGTCRGGERKGALHSFDRIQGVVIGRVVFVDDGRRDDKLLVASEFRELTSSEKTRINVFFRSYEVLKRCLGRLRRKSGCIEFRGIVG